MATAYSEAGSLVLMECRAGSGCHRLDAPPTVRIFLIADGVEVWRDSNETFGLKSHKEEEGVEEEEEEVPTAGTSATAGTEAAAEE